MTTKSFQRAVISLLALLIVLAGASLLVHRARPVHPRVEGSLFIVTSNNRVDVGRDIEVAFIPSVLTKSDVAPEAWVRFGKVLAEAARSARMAFDRAEKSGFQADKRHMESLMDSLKAVEEGYERGAIPAEACGTLASYVAAVPNWVSWEAFAAGDVENIRKDEAGLRNGIQSLRQHWAAMSVGIESVLSAAKNRRTTARVNGDFQFDGVLPGEYVLYATMRDAEEEWVQWIWYRPISVAEQTVIQNLSNRDAVRVTRQLF